MEKTMAEIETGEGDENIRRRRIISCGRKNGRESKVVQEDLADLNSKQTFLHQTGKRYHWPQTIDGDRMWVEGTRLDQTPEKQFVLQNSS